MKLGKRIVSLLVSTAIAITSLIPINLMAFAADPNYQYYNDLQYPDAGAVNLEKTATLVAGTANQWDIQLKVQGKNMPSKPTDVVLVIDTSGSMNYSAGTTEDLLTCNEEAHEHSSSCIGCGYTEEHTHKTTKCGMSCNLQEHTHNWRCYDFFGNLTCRKTEHTHTDACYKCGKVAHQHSDDCYTCGKEEHTHRVNTNDTSPSDGEYCYKSRMQVAKEAYEAFLTRAASSTVSLQFGVVSFEGYENVEQALTTDIQSVKDAIDGLEAGGGTNMHGGIREAQKMLSNGRTGANKVMIVLSDGLPTYAYDKSGNRIGNGSSTTDAIVTATKGAADAADAAGIDVYTIGYNLDDDSVMSYCGKDGYYSATGSGLTDTLLGLIGKLIYAAEDAFVIDPMGPKFNLNIAGSSFSASDYTVTPEGATVTYDAATETLRWNIGKVVEGQSITLTYRVTIDDDAVSDVYYPTNGTTTMYYTDAKDRDAAKDFVVPEVQIGKGTITVLGYLVNDQGQPISQDGRVVNSPEQAYQIYTEQGAYNLGQTHTVTAKDKAPTYELVGESSKRVSLTVSHPTEKVYFQYKVAPEKGNIKVEYFYETTTGEVKVGEDALFTDVVDTAFNASSINVSKNRNDIPADIRDNYDQGTIETSPVPSKYISGTQIIKVLYRHAKGNVVVRYYDLSNNSAFLGDNNYMTNAFVGTAIDTSKINMNAYKPNDNYNNGQFIGTPATTVSNGTTYIDIGYTKIQAGLTVNYVFIGGERPSTAPANGTITVNKGDVIDVDGKKLDFKDFHYSYVETEVTGGLTFADSKYTMTGTSATITITYEMEKVTGRVDHKYNLADGTVETVTGTTATIYRGEQFTVTGTVFTYKGVTYQLKTGVTQPTAGKVTLTQDTVFTYEYVPVMHAVTVQHKYEDVATAQKDAAQSGSYADGTTVNPGSYTANTQNGRYVLVSRDPSASFTLKSDATVTLYYELAKAPLTIVHRYPNLDPVSVNGGSYKIDTQLTVGTVAVPDTKGGLYTFSKYQFNNADIAGTATVNVVQGGITIYVDYVKTQVPVQVVHTYPGITENGVAKTDVSVSMGNRDAGANFATNTVQTLTNNGRYQVTSVQYRAFNGDETSLADTTLNATLNTGLSGLVIVVTYGYTEASITVNHHYAAGVSVPAADVNGSKTTAYVNDVVTPYDSAITSKNGYIYTVSQVKVDNNALANMATDTLTISGDHVIDIYYTIVPATVNVTHTYEKAFETDVPNADIVDPSVTVDANTNFSTGSIHYQTDNGKYAVKEIRVVDNSQQGYYTVSNPQNINVTSAGIQIIVVYSRVAAAGVEVRYTFDDGKETITEPQQGPFYVGDQVTPSDYIKSFDNYTVGTPSPSAVQTLTESQKLVITIPYTRKKANVNISHIGVTYNADGTQSTVPNVTLDSSTLYNQSVGGNITTASYKLTDATKLQGFVYDRVSADSITVSENGNTIIFYYKKYLPANITINHVGTVYNADGTVNTANVNLGSDSDTANRGATVTSADYQLTAQELPEGYSFVSADPASITVDQNSYTITINYKKQLPADITVEYIGTIYNADGTVNTSNIDLGDGSFSAMPGTTVTPADHKLAADPEGYAYEKAEPAPFTVKENKYTIRVYYQKKLPADIAINHIGIIYNADGTENKREDLGNGGIQAVAGANVAATDYVLTSLPQGYAYHNADPATITVTKNKYTINIYYHKQLPADITVKYIGTIYNADGTVAQENISVGADKNFTAMPDTTVTPADHKLSADPEGYAYEKADDAFKVGKNNYVVKVYYKKQLPADITVKYIGTIYNADGTVAQENISVGADKDFTAMPDTTVTPADHKLSADPEGYAYEKADDAFKVAKNSYVVKVYYKKQLPADITVKYIGTIYNADGTVAQENISVGTDKSFTAMPGTTVTPADHKLAADPEGYAYEKADNAFEVTANNHVVKVYYKKVLPADVTVNHIGITYNADGTENKREEFEGGQNFKAEANATVNASDYVLSELPEGFRFDHADPATVTVTENSHVINIYYKKQLPATITVNHIGTIYNADGTVNTADVDLGNDSDTVMPGETVEAQNYVLAELPEGYTFKSVSPETILVEENTYVITINYVKTLPKEIEEEDPPLNPPEPPKEIEEEEPPKGAPETGETIPPVVPMLMIAGVVLGILSFKRKKEEA